jgi:glycerol-3-phosphate acyltransferase PlsX
MVGALLASGALKAMRRKIDPGAANGGPLLGLKGIVIKSHGGADAKSFANAVKVGISLAASAYERDLEASLAALAQSLSDMEDASKLETASGEGHMQVTASAVANKVS